MNINLSEIFSQELETAINETAPDDFPCGDLLKPWEEGVLHFLTVRDDKKKLLGVLAYQALENDGAVQFEIIGMNARGAPLAMRAMFQAIVASADARHAAISCMIEKSAMAKIAERHGLIERARLYVREVA